MKKFLLIGFSAVFSLNVFASEISDYVPFAKVLSGASQMQADPGDLCTLEILQSNGGDGIVARVQGGPNAVMSGAPREFYIQIARENEVILAATGRGSSQFYPGQPEVQNPSERIEIVIGKNTGRANYSVVSGKNLLEFCTEFYLR